MMAGFLKDCLCIAGFYAYITSIYCDAYIHRNDIFDVMHLGIDCFCMVLLVFHVFFLVLIDLGVVVPCFSYHGFFRIFFVFFIFVLFFLILFLSCHVIFSFNLFFGFVFFGFFFCILFFSWILGLCGRIVFTILVSFFGKTKAHFQGAYAVSGRVHFSFIVDDPTR